MSNTIQNITWDVFCERVRRRLFNGWSSIAENVTNREIQLYAYEAIAVVITQQSNNGLQLEGIRSIPEGFITTFQFTSIPKDYDKGVYSVILPSPPVNLPLGYSIVEPYFSGSGSQSYPLIAIHPYQRGYALKLPTPNYGVFYWVEGSTMYIDGNGKTVNQLGTLNVPMLSPRSATGSDSDIMSLPDDAFSMVFDLVISKLTQRLQVPQDNVNDGVMSGTQKS